jgi:hypothetical protein
MVLVTIAVLVAVIMLVVVLVFVGVLVLGRRCRLGRRWHRGASSPEQPQKRGADLANRMMMFGRSVTRAGTAQSIATAASESGHGIATRVGILGHARHSTTRLPRFVSGFAHNQASFIGSLRVEILTVVDEVVCRACRFPTPGRPNSAPSRGRLRSGVSRR